MLIHCKSLHLIYLGLFLTLLVFRIALQWNPGARTTIYRVALWLLFLFSAFRFEVGCDWTGYLNQYEVNLFESIEGVGSREVLWWALIALLRAAEVPYPWLNVISSTMFFGGVHVLAKRQPDPYSFLILLYPVLILNMPMSGIRQGAAIGVICIALAALIDNRLLKFVALTLLASALHASAAVFLLLTPFARGQFSTTRLLAAVLIAGPAGFLLLSGEAELAAARHIGTGDAVGASFRLAALSASGLFFLMLLRSRWRIQFQEDYKLAILGSLIMVPLVAAVAVSTVIGDRLGYYFVPIQAMIFARIPYLKGLPVRGLLTAAPYVGLLAMLAVWTTRSELFKQCYQPYGTWLFGWPEYMRWPF